MFSISLTLKYSQKPHTIQYSPVPVLMVWGEVDVALSIELTEGYEPLVADFTLHRLPRVSHWVHEEAPEKVNAILANWLAAKRLA